MRFLIICLLCFISCKSQKTIDPKRTPNKIVTSPELADGTTTAELIPNAQLHVQTDEFDNNFIDIVPGDKFIFKYHFKRKQLPNTVDGHYEEILYFELADLTQNLSLLDADLNTVHMTYARLCYCKGTSGYFKVKKGGLMVTAQNDTLHVKANFEIDGIPQLINAIAVDFQW